MINGVIKYRVLTSAAVVKYAVRMQVCRCTCFQLSNFLVICTHFCHLMSVTLAEHSVCVFTPPTCTSFFCSGRVLTLCVQPERNDNLLFVSAEHHILCYMCVADCDILYATWVCYREHMCCCECIIELPQFCVLPHSQPNHRVCTHTIQSSM